MVELKIGKELLHLYCNGAAAVAIGKMEAAYEDKHDDKKSIVELILGNDLENHNILCSVVAILAQQGELLRRYEGYDKGKMVEADWLNLVARPIDIMRMREAAVKTILDGYASEDLEPDERDPLLEELEKKTENR